MTPLVVAQTNSQIIIPAEELPSPDVGWFAGLFDGEGCISIQQRITDGLPHISPRILVGNTDRRAISLFWHRFGGSVYRQQLRPNRKPCYNWKLAARTAIVKTLEELLPHLILKHEEAKLMLEYCALPWRGHNSNLPRLAEQVVVDVQYAQRIKELKRLVV